MLFWGRRPHQFFFFFFFTGLSLCLAWCGLVHSVVPAVGVVVWRLVCSNGGWVATHVNVACGVVLCTAVVSAVAGRHYDDMFCTAFLSLAFLGTVAMHRLQTRQPTGQKQHIPPSHVLLLLVEAAALPLFTYPLSAAWWVLLFSFAHFFLSFPQPNKEE